MFFPFFPTRSVLLPGKDGTAGKTITPSECVWHVPCLSPPLQQESASIASNRPQPCDMPAHTRTTWWPSGFFLHSPQAPFFNLSSFILHCSLSQWGAHHIFVDSHLPYLWCCFKATRQKPLGVGGGETDSKKKEIQHWLHLVEVHNTKSKTAHWQEQSIFLSFLFFVSPFHIVVNKDYF